MTDIHQIVNRQINRWNQEISLYKESLKLDESAEHPAKAKPVVTLSRQRGCRGREFAHLLAHELHYGLFDRQIVNYIAEHMGVRSEMVESLDEHERSALEIWVQGMLNQRLVERDDYFRALAEAVKTISFQGGVVILGRGANFLLRRTNAFHLRLIAPIEIRIRNLADYRGVEPSEAEKEIERVDGERAQFIKRYYRHDINDPCVYDLTINMENTTLDAAVKIALSALRARGWSLELTGGDKRTRAKKLP
ncbi:MAG: cytidylate kinase-like family protein [Candidatus Omnitrophota bacterium]